MIEMTLALNETQWTYNIITVLCEDGVGSNISRFQDHSSLYTREIGVRVSGCKTVHTADEHQPWACTFVSRMANLGQLLGMYSNDSSCK